MNPKNDVQMTMPIKQVIFVMHDHNSDQKTLFCEVRFTMVKKKK